MKYLIFKHARDFLYLGKWSVVSFSESTKINSSQKYRNTNALSNHRYTQFLNIAFSSLTVLSRTVGLISREQAIYKKPYLFSVGALDALWPSWFVALGSLSRVRALFWSCFS